MVAVCPCLLALNAAALPEKREQNDPQGQSHMEGANMCTVRLLLWHGRGERLRKNEKGGERGQGPQPAGQWLCIRAP